MSKDRVEELEEIMAHDEQYLAWYEAQTQAGQEASDEEYLKWYIESKQTKSRPHATKEIPAKIGTRKHALATDKMKADRKAMRKDQESMRIAKMARREEILLEKAEKVYAVAETEEEIAKAVELFKQARAVEKRMQSNGRQKKYDAQKAKEKRNYKQHQETDRRVYGQVVEETWGQEKGEFATLADKENFEKRSAAAKKGAETKKANQEASDRVYEQWYCETAFGGKSK